MTKAFHRISYQHQPCNLRATPMNGRQKSRWVEGKRSEGVRRTVRSIERWNYVDFLLLMVTTLQCLAGVRRVFGFVPPLSASTTGELVYAISGTKIALVRRRWATGVQLDNLLKKLVIRLSDIQYCQSILLRLRYLERITKIDEGRTNESMVSPSAALCTGVRLVLQRSTGPFPPSNLESFS